MKNKYRSGISTVFFITLWFPNHIRQTSIYSPGCAMRYGELCNLYKETSTVKIINIARLKWLWHVARMEDKVPSWTITFSQPEGSRKKGRPWFRCLDSALKPSQDLGSECMVEESTGQESVKWNPQGGQGTQGAIMQKKKIIQTSTHMGNLPYFR